jgi:SAM-dependent methyltransferase
MDWKDGKEDYYRNESQMFNLTADYYDRYRPSYPGEIVNTLIDKAKINEKSIILEIGAGSGKATELLAGINCTITCVDPGADLVRRGNDRFKDFPKIKFSCARYEEFESSADTYDLICAFQAFHWVPQPIGYRKCAHELKDIGFLALVWNMYVTYDNDLDKELLQISSKYGGFADFVSEEKCKERITAVVKSIDDSALFNKVEVYKHFWEQPYTADDYFGFCLTGNSFVQKSDEEKKSAYDDICKLAEKHGGMIVRPYSCVLYLTSKRQNL